MPKKYIKGYRCSICKELKPTYEFKILASAIGVDRSPLRCKQCIAKKAEKTGSYPATGKPGSEERKTYTKAYRSANKERMAQQQREWNQRNLSKVAELNKRWKKQNPERVRAIRLRRRAAEVEAEGTHTADELIEIYESQQGLCAYCETPLFGNYHVDHMIPLSKGGRNDWTNLAIACAWCNVSKCAKTSEEFMEYLKCRN